VIEKLSQREMAASSKIGARRSKSPGETCMRPFDRTPACMILCGSGYGKGRRITPSTTLNIALAAAIATARIAITGSANPGRRSEARAANAASRRRS